MIRHSVRSAGQRRNTLALALLAYALAGCQPEIGSTGDRGNTSDVLRHVDGGDAQRGRVTMSAIGCGSCHSIPGVRGARGMVGPSLDHWRERRLIAGVVPNDTQRLITWLTVPQAIAPGSAMPNMGVTDGEARDMAAYLYSLR